MFQLHTLLDKVLSIPECDWWLSLLTGEGVGEEPAPWSTGREDDSDEGFVQYSFCEGSVNAIFLHFLISY